MIVKARVACLYKLIEQIVCLLGPLLWQCELLRRSLAHSVQEPCGHNLGPVPISFCLRRWIWLRQPTGKTKTNLATRLWKAVGLLLYYHFRF